MSLSPAQQYLQDFTRLAHARSWSERNQVLAAMEKLYVRLDPDSREAIVLGFALAKIYGDLGDIERSFDLLIEVNRRHRAGKTDTIEDARATVSAVRRLFTEETITPRPVASRWRPVFIIGLPRSGTTLVEQSLTMHPAVTGGGEPKLLGQWCHGYLRRWQTGAGSLNAHLPQLQSHYLGGLGAVANGGHVTDKMPLNFLWLGFIQAAFPDAVIVHTVRDPMATCWSLFKTPFAGRSNGYACDLADIGEFYGLYRKLMAFWEERFPGRCFVLDYERLTRKQEAETRQLLAHCGLEWDPACLDFHRNPRPAHTASEDQVRQPLYSGSSAAWKRYESHLAPLREALARDGWV